MALPGVANLVVYLGDPYFLKVPFVDDGGNPVDVSDVTFTASLADAAIGWAVDLTHAADGYIILSLTGAQTTALAQLVTPWDLAGSRWRETITRGQIIVTKRAKDGVVIP